MLVCVALYSSYQENTGWWVVNLLNVLITHPPVGRCMNIRHRKILDWNDRTRYSVSVFVYTYISKSWK